MVMEKLILCLVMLLVLQCSIGNFMAFLGLQQLKLKTDPLISRFKCLRPFLLGMKITTYFNSQYIGHKKWMTHQSESFSANCIYRKPSAYDHLNAKIPHAETGVCIHCCMAMVIPHLCLKIVCCVICLTGHMYSRIVIDYSDYSLLTAVFFFWKSNLAVLPCRKSVKHSKYKLYIWKFTSQQNCLRIFGELNSVPYNYCWQLPNKYCWQLPNNYCWQLPDNYCWHLPDNYCWQLLCIAGASCWRIALQMFMSIKK